MHTWSPSKVECSEESTNQDKNCWKDESNDIIPPDPYILGQHKVHIQEFVKPHLHIWKEICNCSCGCLPCQCRILWGRSTWGLLGAEQAASRAADHWVEALSLIQRLQRIWTSCLYANGLFTAKSRSTLMPRKLEKDAARLIFCTLMNTRQRVEPKGHICSLSTRVMRGMMSPTKMSTSASKIMNMWKRCFLSLGQRRMTTIRIMPTGSEELCRVWGCWGKRRWTAAFVFPSSHPAQQLTLSLHVFQLGSDDLVLLIVAYQ